LEAKEKGYPKSLEATSQSLRMSCIGATNLGNVEQSSGSGSAHRSAGALHGSCFDLTAPHAATKGSDLSKNVGQGSDEGSGSAGNFARLLS